MYAEGAVRAASLGSWSQKEVLSYRKTYRDGRIVSTDAPQPVDKSIQPRAWHHSCLGLRSEGQPVEDLVGSSDGFRRPGMNIAVEPSLSWMKNGWSASLSVPVVFYNERFQSVPDQQWQDVTGIPRHGDASFADYYVMLSVGRQF